MYNLFFVSLHCDERKETFPSEKSLEKNKKKAPGNETLKNFFVYLQQKRKTTTFYKQF